MVKWKFLGSVSRKWRHCFYAWIPFPPAADEYNRRGRQPKTLTHSKRQERNMINVSKAVFNHTVIVKEDHLVFCFTTPNTIRTTSFSLTVLSGCGIKPTNHLVSAGDDRWERLRFGWNDIPTMWAIGSIYPFPAEWYRRWNLRSKETTTLLKAIGMLQEIRSMIASARDRSERLVSGVGSNSLFSGFRNTSSMRNGKYGWCISARSLVSFPIAASTADCHLT